MLLFSTEQSLSSFEFRFWDRPVSEFPGHLPPDVGSERNQTKTLDITDDNVALILGRKDLGKGFVANLSPRPFRITYWMPVKNNEIIVEWKEVGPGTHLLLPRETIELGISRGMIWVFECGKRLYT